MNHAKLLSYAHAHEIPVTLTIGPHFSQPALETDPMYVAQVDETSAGFILAERSDAEREYAFDRIEGVHYILPDEVLEESAQEGRKRRQEAIKRAGDAVRAGSAWL